MFKNLLVFIHGITPDRDPPDPGAAGQSYDAFINAVKKFDPFILDKFDKTIEIKWGKKYPDSPAEDYVNYRLSDAEARITDFSADDTTNSPTNIWKEKSRPWYHPIDLAIASKMRDIKRSIVTYGLTDAIYYCSADGERDMRTFVYKQIAGAILDQVKLGHEVALHVVAHSLGVTVAHDFLYGIFNKNQASDFSNDPAILDEVRNLYKGVQAASFVKDSRKVYLGSFTAMASQLPLMAVRRSKLIELFASGNKMDCSDVGVGTLGSYMQVSFFHDQDDVLGFPSKNLYAANSSIRDVSVDNGLDPAGAHTGYWTNTDVVDRVTEMWLNSLHEQQARDAAAVKPPSSS